VRGDPAHLSAYLASQDRKSQLRFITCGSVDDGKSTLIGRLLYESKAIYDDQLSALAGDSQKFGTQGDQLDLALVVDGLAAEREQGITIDVAYRYFSTEQRTFIVADTPGHEQYTRNMVTGASTADVAVVIIDARHGILTQTKRHSFLVSLLGIRHVIVAINKLDLLAYDESVFRTIEAEFLSFAQAISLTNVVCVPVSALHGDNVVTKSDRTPWYTGPSVLDHLETIEVRSSGPSDDGPFRLPVQWVIRPDSHFRGYSGRVMAGSIAVNDRVRIAPSGKESTVARIVTFDGDLPLAVKGQSVTLVLADERDVSRGDVVCAAQQPIAVADQFEAHIVWMHETNMLPGRSYLAKIGTTVVGAVVTQTKFKLNVNTLEHIAAKTLQLNEIGVCNVSFDRQVPFEPYNDNRDLGGFLLIDRLTNATVGVGMIHFALRRADNVHWQAVEVNKAAHASLKNQRPAVVWFTGLSAAGKSTIANIVERQLHALGHHTYLLDGDNVRHGLNRDLGFTEADRVENIRRVAEVAGLMVDAGLIVLVSFISPFEAERRLARERVGPDEFVEVFVDTPLAEAQQRDPKGLYRKAREGQLKNLTGVDSPYEAPTNAEIHVRTPELSAEESAQKVLDYLRSVGIVRGDKSSP
jgi:bifunctional enzyme CysN/CysC